MAKALYGREILDVGDWPASTGDIKIASSAIDALVSSFEALGLSGRVPLKFGHGESEKDQPFREGLPALGWVSRLYRQGTKLLADFTDIPDVVFDAIQKNLYKFVSVELLRDVQAGTRKLPWVLDAVALLGAEQPAVGTLKDLQALLAARKPVLQARARVALRRGSIHFSTGAKQAMDETEVKALLKKQADELTANFTSELRKVQDANAQALAAEQEKTRKAEIARHRDAIKAKFEAAVKAEAIKPAVRESFYKLTRIDNDAAVMDIKAEDADAYITEHTDKAALARKTETQQGADADEEKDLRPDQIVAKRTEKLCHSRQQDPRKSEHYMRAVTEVLKADEKLADAYKYMPDTLYRQAS